MRLPPPDEAVSAWAAFEQAEAGALAGAWLDNAAVRLRTLAGVPSVVPGGDLPALAGEFKLGYACGAAVAVVANYGNEVAYA